MSGIYISNMRMPAEGWHKTIKIFSDGTVVSYYDSVKLGKATPVPSHGDLIEESKVLDIVSEWCPDDDGSVGKDGDLREMLDEIEALPTVISADTDEGVEG